MAKDDWIRIKADDIYKGIGDNSFGMGEIRNMNLSEEPGIAMVNKSLLILSPTALDDRTFTANAGTDIITTSDNFNYSSSTNGYTGSARCVQVSSTGTLPAGLSSTAYYFIKIIDNNAKQYKLCTDYNLDNIVNITDAGTGTHTITTIDPEGISDDYSYFTDDIGNNFYFVDDNSRLWRLSVGDRVPELLQGHTAQTCRGLAVWKGYLFYLRATSIDVCNLTNLGNIQSADWTNSWKSITSADHQAIIGQDDVLYFCNKSSIGSILENSGYTFDPATSGTYTFNASALDLPSNFTTAFITELGSNLKIATNDGRLYSWDRISDSFDFPLIYSSNIVQMITVNGLVYSFHESENAIYATDGTFIKKIKQIPEFLSNSFTSSNTTTSFSNPVKVKNKIVFGVGNRVGISGVYSLNLDNNALIFENTVSTHNTGDVAEPLIINYIGSLSASTNFIVYYSDYASDPSDRIDALTTSWYGSFRSFLTTPLIRLGTANDLVTLQKLEIETDSILNNDSSVEGFKLAYRNELTADFTDIATEYGDGTFKDRTIYNFKLGGLSLNQIQFRVYAQSASTSGATRCRIRELRFR